MLLAAFAYSQSFEVASVKPAVMPDFARGSWVGHISGGPGTADPGRYSCERCDLYNLVLMAYNLRSDELSAPDWMRSAGFDIAAKVPESATKEQFRTMLQGLLGERFHLMLHHEQKQTQVGELTVAKGGAKLKETPKGPQSEAAPSAETAKMKLDQDGFPVLPPGQHFAMIMMNDQGRIRASAMPMKDFAAWLAGQTGQPVTDSTGLKGNYDFLLSWGAGGLRTNAGDPDTSGPTLIEALQRQLGLRLESKKGPVDLIVVDHADKMPADN